MKSLLTIYPTDDRSVDIPDVAIAEFRAFSSTLQSKSGLAWGEHCTECAAPSCYTSCNLFTPAPDLSCRRFVSGIAGVRGSHDLPLRVIQFRKWGKLESEGPSVNNLAEPLSEKSDTGRVNTFLQALPQPLRLRNRITRRLNAFDQQREQESAQDYHGFVIETWSANTTDEEFTVKLLQKAGASMFQDSFRIGKGYRRHWIPLQLIAKQVDLRQPFLVQIEPVNEGGSSEILFGVVDFVSLQRPEQSSTKVSATAPGAPSAKAKVVVWDLDNTLWDGTLAETGVMGITLRPQAIETIKELDRRGILHSVASKNDADEGAKALDHFGLSQYFLAPQIGWGPKSDSIREIARQLDLGVDSFIFLDDQAFERAEVSEAHPSIQVFDDSMATKLLDHPRCDVPVSPEASRRRLMYQEELKRNELMQAGQTDYVSFLRSCQITLEIGSPSLVDRPRILELVQRTNQLNFGGAKYSRDELDAILDGNAHLSAFVLKCSDRFGDYGTIGFAIVSLQQAIVTDFFMSCRVQRKQVESAFFSRLRLKLLAQGRDALVVKFRKTERNGASLRMLSELGFIGDVSAERGTLTRSLKDDFLLSDVVLVSEN